MKTFKEYLNEKDNKDIEEAVPLKPLPSDIKDDTSCETCGAKEFPCECYTEDYYDAKIPQQIPRASIKKPKK